MSNNELSIRCEIKALTPFRAGAPMQVTGTLHNMGASPVWILKRSTFLTSQGHHCLVLMRGTEHLLDADLPASAETDEDKDDALRIPAGGTASAQMDLATSYPHAEPGTYLASLRMPVYGAVELEPNVRPLLRTDFQYAFVESEPVAVEIQTGSSVADSAHWSLGQASAAVTPPLGPKFPDEPLDPVFRSMNKGEEAEILEAHRWAYRSILTAIAAVQDENDGGYRGWMDLNSTGTEAEKRRVKVLAYLAAMAAWMSTAHVVYEKNDFPRTPPRNPDWMAGTIKGGKSVITLRSWVFDYWKLILVDWNEFPAFRGRASTLAFIVLHEVTHAAAGTEDNEVGYGRAACAELARKNPNGAVNNAQNYALWAMSGNQNSPPGYKPSNGMWETFPVPQVGNASPAGVGAAALSGKPAVMIAYQDESTKYGGALIFKVLAGADSKDSAHWLPSAPILNEDSQSFCGFWDNRDWHVHGRPTPALLGWADGSDQYVYCAFVDLYTKRVALIKSDPVDDAIASGDCSNTRWRQVSNLSSFSDSSETIGAALTHYNEHIYCVYVTSENKLKCVRSKDGEYFEEVPMVRGTMTFGKDVISAPSLAVFKGDLICTFVSGKGSSKTNNMLRFKDGKWDSCRSFDEVVVAENLAIAPRVSMDGEWLVALGKGLGLKTLRYWVSTSSPGFDEKMWGGQQFMTAHARTSPALVCVGSTMLGFYQDEDRQLEWLIAEGDPALPVVPVF
ncbi:MAG: M35 family metallo-endopeptidase [Telluria sp.]